MIRDLFVSMKSKFFELGDFLFCLCQMGVGIARDFFCSQNTRPILMAAIDAKASFLNLESLLEERGSLPGCDDRKGWE